MPLCSGFGLPNKFGMENEIMPENFKKLGRSSMLQKLHCHVDCHVHVQKIHACVILNLQAGCMLVPYRAVNMPNMAFVTGFTENILPECVLLQKNENHQRGRGC